MRADFTERLAALDAAQMLVDAVVIRAVARNYRSQMDLNRRLLDEARRSLPPPR